MQLVHYVKEEEAKLAKKMEAKLLALPVESGILFAGVSVEPSTPSSSAVYRVWIGCSRSLRKSSNMKAAISTRPMNSMPYLPARVLIE